MTPIRPWINPANNKTFVPTLKIASGTVGQRLNENGWKRFDIVYHDHNVFGITRHPYDRWLSGMAQIMSDRQEVFDGDIPRLIAKSYDNEHTQPQIWNFANCSNIKLFKLEHLDKFWELLDIENNDLHLRDNTKMGSQGELKTELDKAAEPFKDSIIDAYSYDLTLWENSI